MPYGFPRHSDRVTAESILRTADSAAKTANVSDFGLLSIPAYGLANDARIPLMFCSSPPVLPPLRPGSDRCRTAGSRPLGGRRACRRSCGSARRRPAPGCDERPEFLPALSSSPAADAAPGGGCRADTSRVRCFLGLRPCPAAPSVIGGTVGGAPHSRRSDVHETESFRANAKRWAKPPPTRSRRAHIQRPSPRDPTCRPSEQMDRRRPLRRNRADPRPGAPAEAD